MFTGVSFLATGVGESGDGLVLSAQKIVGSIPLEVLLPKMETSTFCLQVGSWFLEKTRLEQILITRKLN